MYKKAIQALILTLLISTTSVMAQSKRQASQDLSHLYGKNYEEVLDKYGDNPRMLAQMASEFRNQTAFTNRLNRFAKGSADTPWVIRGENEANNFFDSADDINDVLATNGWKLDGDGSSEFKGGLISASLTDGDVDVYKFTVDANTMYYFASTHSFDSAGEDDLPVRGRLFHASDLDTTTVEDFKGIAGNDQMSGDLLGRPTDGRNGSDDFRITGWSAYVDQATGQLVEGDYYLWVYSDAGKAGNYHLVAYGVEFAPLQAKFEQNQTNVDVLNGGLVSTLPTDGVVRSFMAHNADTVKVQSPEVPSASNATYDQLMARGDEDVDNYLIQYEAGNTLVIETMPYFGWYRTPEGDIGPGGSRLTDPRILLFDADYQNRIGDNDDGAREQMDGPNNIHSRFAYSSADLAAAGIAEDSPLWLSVMAWASKTRIALSGGSAADIAGRGVDNSDPGRFVYDLYAYQYSDDLIEANHEPNDSPETAMSIAARTDTVATGNFASAGDVDYYRVFLHQVRMYTMVVPNGATVEIMHEYEANNASGATAMTGDLLGTGGFRYNPTESVDGNSKVLSGLVVQNTGAYLVKVTGAAAGDYTMAVLDKGQIWSGLNANEPDNDNTGALAQDALEVGPGAAARTAAIFPSGDVDIHQFSVSAGFEMSLTLNATSDLAADFAGTMTLYNPSGVEVASNASAISHTAAEAGTYTLKIEAADGASVGFYVLSGGEPFTEKEPNNDFANATAIALGQLYEANMGAGDTDFYKFTLEAGKSYSFRSVDNQTGGAFSSVEFFDTAGGTTLMDDSGWPDNYSGSNFKIANIIPSETKTYYLKVAGNPGAYKVVSRVNENFGAWANLGEPNNSKSEADANGSYQAFGADVGYALFNESHPRWFGDEDWYRVDVKAGQTLDVEAKPVEGPGGPDLWNRDTDTRIVIFDADGTTELVNDDDGGNSWYSKASYVATTDGPLYVQIRTSRSPESGDDRSLNRGDYLLNINVSTSEVESNNTFAEADANVLSPGVVSAEFGDDDQVDIFRLDLMADHIYHVRTFRPEGGYEEGFTAELFKAGNTSTDLLDGTGYTSRYSGSNLKLNIIPDATEAYYLRLSAGGNGAYQVALKGRDISTLKSEGEPNNSIADADAIGAQQFDAPGEWKLSMLYNADFPWTEGQPISARFGDDRDFYRYDLAAGDTLIAETAPADGPLWPRDYDGYMELHAADGSELDTNDDGGFDWHSKITYVATQAQSVYVVIRGQDLGGATDRDPSRGEYLLNVQRLNGSGTSVDTETMELPENFVLEQNYPNPFNPSTTLRYAIPQSGDVKLTVFNLLGQRVATLVNATQAAGQYQVTFDASNLASGVYLYRLEAGDFMSMKKMLLIK